jgi:hypothetical protein
VVKQENQNSEGLTSKPNPDAALEQFPGAGIHFERPECHASGSLGLMGHGGFGTEQVYYGQERWNDIRGSLMVSMA